jgi:hypothetical protein
MTAATSPQNDQHLADGVVNAFEAWKQYQSVAMHFNDLLMRLRLQSLAAVGGLTAVAAVVVKAGVDPATQWEALASAFSFLGLFWIAIWILDFCYYNRLLVGAVDALIQLEREIQSGAVTHSLLLSTRIEAIVAEGKQPDNGKLGREHARWWFYAIVFAALMTGLGISIVKAISPRDATRLSASGATELTTIKCSFLDAAFNFMPTESILQISAQTRRAVNLSFIPARHGEVKIFENGYVLEFADLPVFLERFTINRYTAAGRRELVDSKGTVGPRDRSELTCQPYEKKPL